MMSKTPRALETTHGTIQFPTFMPVTTFGGKYPLDDLLRPYLPRFSQCVMVSYYYAKQMKAKERPKLPLFIDSGGFASLFKDSKAVADEDYVSIQTKDEEVISPAEVLAFQEKHADIGATLDFIITPSVEKDEAQQRQDWTIQNAKWAIENKKNDDLRLFASMQAWDTESANQIMEELRCLPFDGFALGGMVPRARNPDLIVEIVKALKKVEPTRPIHVFGIGNPRLISLVKEAGADSTDSSSFLRNTADKKFLDTESLEWRPIEKAELTCNCPICRMHSMSFLRQPGEVNSLSLALHNLAINASVPNLR
jgi:helicase